MGWHIAEISMGTYGTFDVRNNDINGRKNVQTVVKEAIKQGVNLFDTARMYGNSEDALGEALTILKERKLIDYGTPFTKKSEGNRPHIFVATKVWASSVKEARRQIKYSFEALRCDYIDLFQIHNLGIWKELLPLLKQMRTQNQIGAIGVTHYSDTSFSDILEAIHTGDVDVVQVPYNINQTKAAQVIFPEVQKLDLGVLIMSPISLLFNRGQLLQKLKKLDLTRFKRYGCETPAQVLLKFVISHPAVTAAIPATTKAEHVIENVAVSNGRDMDRTDQEFLMRLDF
ncbi:MAG: aldo/keto reductase [Candidatus Helarchaeota archaeon]